MSLAREITADIVSKLFKAENRRLGAILLGINNKNKEIARVAFDGFLYNGTYHLPFYDHIIRPGKNRKPGLDPSLQEEMKEYLKDWETVEEDRFMIRQVLFKILEPCGVAMQDMRDTLPECVLDLRSELMNLFRTREPGFTLVQGSHIRKQFDEYEPKIAFYATARLMY